MIVEFEKLITFNSKFDAYKYKVLSFELIEKSFTWQHYMNDVFFEYLNDFSFAYLDDILIYSKTLKKHRKHVKKILIKLKKIEFQIDIDKCEFHVKKIKFLKLIFEINDVKMNSAKIKIIIEWNISICLKKVKSFIKFCNFYKRFITKNGFIKVL